MRFPAKTKSEKTKDFYVSPHARIGDPGGTGKILVGGDKISLTKKQAEFLMEKRVIDVALPDFGADEDPDPVDVPDSSSEASSGPSADGDGDEVVGGVSAKDDAPKTRKSSVGGRKTPL